MDRIRPAIRAALAALLLLPADAVRGGSGDASDVLPEAPPLMDLAFRIVDESADPAGIFGDGGAPLPDGFEPASDGSPLWRRIGPPPDDDELARIARSSPRPGCDLLLEPRPADGKTLYAPLFVFRKVELTGHDVADAWVRPPEMAGTDSLGFEFNWKAEPVAARVWRQLLPGGLWAPRDGRTGGRMVVMADGRLLGVARAGRPPLLWYTFPCGNNREEALAVEKAYHATTPTHLFTASAADTSGLTDAEARDRSIPGLSRRYLALTGNNPDAIPPQVVPEGETGIAITLPPLSPQRQRIILSAMTLPTAIVFRPVAPGNDAWVRTLFDAPPPDGFETVTAPDGAPAWLPSAPLPEDDDSDGNPDLGPSAVPDGCLLAWENLRGGTDIPPGRAGPAYPARRPCLLAADAVLDVAAVEAARPVALPGVGNAIRVTLSPADRAALEEMARALSPDRRIAFILYNRIQSMPTAGEILDGAPLYIHSTPIGGLDAPTPDPMNSFISVLSLLLETGTVPATVHYEGTR
jgi:hypothetical protein